MSSKEEELLVVLSNTKDLFSLSYLVEEHECLRSDTFLRRLAYNLQLPRADSFEKLCDYSLLNSRGKFIIACITGDSRVARLCLNKNDPKDGLLLAIHHGQMDVIRFFVEFDLVVIDNTVAEIAVDSGRKEIVRYFVNKGTNISLNLISRTIREDNLEMFIILMDAHNTNMYIDKLIQKASEYKREEMIKILVDIDELIKLI